MEKRPWFFVRDQIPKLVRDYSKWLFRKGWILSFRQSSWSESRCSCFIALTKNEEQILALEEQVFYSENGEPLSGQPVSFALTDLQPPTSDPGLFYNLQLTSWNLQLFFSANGEPLNGQPVPLLFPTTNPLTPTTFPKAQILNRSISG